MIVVVTDSIYLLEASSGEIQRHLRWRAESVEYVENFGRKLAAIFRDRTFSGTTKISICNAAKSTANTVSHDVWSHALRYSQETRMGYLSHSNGVRVLDANANTLTEVEVPDEGVGVVDVKDKTIYRNLARPSLALRHPVV